MSRARRRGAAWWLALVLLPACPALAAGPAPQAPASASASAAGTIAALARDSRLLDLAGWEDAPLRPWRTRNDFTDRVADPRELGSRHAFVEVNLDRYLHDPEYACRRPALARFFHARLGPAAVPAATCATTLSFMQAAGDTGAPLLALDPARIYAIDYLLADGNDQPMSRWGHSMLRLVVCAPGHAPGPECRFDLAEHLVLSFRAFVDDVQVSSWRGLTGSYPSRLFVLPLSQVVAEYTETELRGLRSIPLRLSSAEIASLLQRAAQLHWSYDGRYAFIGNNCAVETARLLSVGVPRLGTAGLMSITPIGLARRLQRAGIADAGVLADRAEAVRLGYYFEPADAHRQAIYAVARASLELPWPEAADWLALPAAQRAGVFDAAGPRAASALLLLEQQALRRLQLRARDALKHHLSDRRRAAARQVLALEDRLTRPATLLPDTGYGLPQPGELASLASRSKELSARLRHDRQDLLARARTWLEPGLRAELDATEANLARLRDHLRSLQAVQNGVDLH